MTKIVIPVMDAEGKVLSGHFGIAPYFVWYEVVAGAVTEKGIVPNDSDHFGGKGAPPERIQMLNPDAVISPGMGMKAINMFQGMKIAVLKGEGPTVEENIQLFIEGSLQELTEGCLHVHD